MGNCMSCGGSAKRKMAAGRSTTNKLNNPKGFAKAQKGGTNPENQMYGVPNAGPTGNNLTGTYSYKKGGVTTSRAVSAGCRNGMVKDATGKCVMERKFKNGGTTKAAKFAALAAPKNKITFADKIAGAKKNARK